MWRLTCHVFKEDTYHPLYTLCGESYCAHQKTSLHCSPDARQQHTATSDWLGKFSVRVLSCLNSLPSVNFSTTATQIILGVVIIKPAGEEIEDQWDLSHWGWVLPTWQQKHLLSDWLTGAVKSCRDTTLRNTNIILCNILSHVIFI